MLRVSHSETAAEYGLGALPCEGRHESIELRLDGGGPLELNIEGRLDLLQQLLLSVQP